MNKSEMCLHDIESVENDLIVLADAFAEIGKNARLNGLDNIFPVILSDLTDVEHGIIKNLKFKIILIVKSYMLRRIFKKTEKIGMNNYE